MQKLEICNPHLIIMICMPVNADDQFLFTWVSFVGTVHILNLDRLMSPHDVLQGF